MPITRTLARYFRILQRYAVIGMVRKSQYRAEFITQVVMDCIWYTLHIAVFEILFEHTADIAGWTRPEIRIFLGFMFVADAFMMTFLGACWRFARDLKDGRLDPFRVRPASCVFLFFFQQFSLEGAINLLIATTYLLVVTHWSVPLTTLAVWPLLLWGIAVACLARYILLVLYSICEFYFVNSELAGFLDDVFDSAVERPLDVFGRRLRLVFIFALPIGLQSYVPAAILLGKISLAGGLVISVWLGLFCWLVTSCWNRGFRRYESAMG